VPQLLFASFGESYILFSLGHNASPILENSFLAEKMWGAIFLLRITSSQVQTSRMTA
jgi:hypothetical protein